MHKIARRVLVGLFISVMFAVIVCPLSSEAGSANNKAEKIKQIIAATELGQYLDTNNMEFKKAVSTNIPGWKIYQFLMSTNGSALQKPILLFYNSESEIIALGMVIDNGKIVMPKDKTAFNPGLRSTTPEVVASFRTDYREVINPEGKQVLYLFYDPDCPYCKVLEKKLSNYNGTFRIIRKWFPLVQIHPGAKEKAINRQVEILKANGITENADEIATRIVEEDMEDGHKAGITGTPMIVAVNGKILPAVPDIEY